MLFDRYPLQYAVVEPYELQKTFKLSLWNQHFFFVAPVVAKTPKLKGKYINIYSKTIPRCRICRDLKCVRLFIHSLFSRDVALVQLRSLFSYFFPTSCLLASALHSAAGLCTGSKSHIRTEFVFSCQKVIFYPFLKIFILKLLKLSRF
jgi:hypothetical protein